MLIQCGGLGLLTFASAFTLIARKKLGFTNLYKGLEGYYEIEDKYKDADKNLKLFKTSNPSIKEFV